MHSAGSNLKFLAVFHVKRHRGESLVVRWDLSFSLFSGFMTNSGLGREIILVNESFCRLSRCRGSSGRTFRSY